MDLNNIIHRLDKKLVISLLRTRILELQAASRYVDQTPISHICNPTHPFKGCRVLSAAGEDLPLDPDTMPVLVDSARSIPDLFAQVSKAPNCKEPTETSSN